MEEQFSSPFSFGAPSKLVMNGPEDGIFNGYNGSRSQKTGSIVGCWNCHRQQLLRGHSQATDQRNCQCDLSTCRTSHMIKGPFDHSRGQVLDNSATLLQRVASLYASEELSDIQLVVGNTEYPAHKLVLCISSDVFRIMLTNPTWPDSQKPRIVLKEEPDCINVFDDFLRYLYTGTVHLTHDNVQPILMLADKYNIADLKEVCIDYMCNHVVSTTEGVHAVSWLQYAWICGHHSLASTCHEFIKWNFHKVASSRDFLTMDKAVLIDFLRESALVVPDESVLFHLVCRWLHHHQGKRSEGSAFHDLVLEVLSEIRFPMMGPAQLEQITPDCLGYALRDFFTSELACAYDYHTACPERRKHLASTADNPSVYTPRNYTNDTWSTLLSIDNFSSLREHDVRPLIFVSPVSGSMADDHQQWEWSVDLFPKGIHFQKCIMIGLFRNLELGGAVYNTVRLILETRTPEERHVDVSILIEGVQDCVDYIKKVVRKKCIFGEATRVHHFKDLVPFDELNMAKSPYLSGPEGNSFKIRIIIKPV